MSSSVRLSRARSLRRRSSRTAGRPPGSIAAMSAPEPLIAEHLDLLAEEVGHHAS